MAISGTVDSFIEKSISAVGACYIDADCKACHVGDAHWYLKQVSDGIAIYTCNGITKAKYIGTVCNLDYAIGVCTVRPNN